MATAAETFDVIVIGAGPAGENAAGRCADGGMSVAIVERELVGGECSYWGCIPSKVLVRPGEVLAAVRRVPGAAAALTGAIDVAAVFAKRDEATSGWHDDGQLPWLKEHAIELRRGTARLAGERVVEVTAADGTATILTANVAVVVATGTTAAVPPIPGLGDVMAWSNREVTSLHQLPRRLLVLGGGAIGAEMAQALRRLGCEEVSVVEGADRLLSREEPFAGAQVAEALRSEGVTVLTGVSMRGVHRNPHGAIVATLADGTTIEADEILVAAGRRPATVDLGLETVGLEPGRSIAVDERLRAVGVPGQWLYAVGDCNGRSLLTHMGKYQARIAVDAILGKPAASDLASDAIVPRVTFTDPQVCAVGLTEAQARERGLPIRCVEHSTGAVAGAYTQADGYTGMAKLVVDQERRVVVGATFTGHGIAELLHSATVAIAGEVTLDRLWHAVPSFPTLSEVWLRLLEAYGL